MDKWVKNISGSEKRWLGRLIPNNGYTEMKREMWGHFFSCDIIRDAIDNDEAKASMDGTTTIDDKAMGKAYLYDTHTANYVMFGNLTTPASSSAKGCQGMMCADASYIYFCTATDTWERVAISTW